MTLTKRQTEVLDTIRAFISAKGFGPTFRQLAELLGIRSPNGVTCHIKALERKGVISRQPGQARTIVIVDEVSP